MDAQTIGWILLCTAASMSLATGLVLYAAAKLLDGGGE